MEVDERLSEQSATVSVNATPNGSEMMEIDNEMTNSEKAMVGAACRLEYELYAVLVHRGSHIGGHYYAYIKVLFTPIHLLLIYTSVLLVEEVGPL